MARGDVRIAVTLACEDCKRRNYQTNKSKRNNPDRITHAQVLQVVPVPHQPQGDPLAREARRGPSATARARPQAAGARAAEQPWSSPDRAAPRECAGLARPCLRSGARSSRRRIVSGAEGDAADDGLGADVDEAEIERRGRSRRLRSRPRRAGTVPSPLASPAGATTHGGNRFINFLRASLGRAPARPVAGPPQVGQATARRARLRRHRRHLPRPADATSQSRHRRHPLSFDRLENHVPLVRRQHLLRAREQGQAEPRAPRRLARPEARRPPGRRPDRDRLRDEGRPEGPAGEAHDARLRARQHGPQRGLLAARQGHARA